MATGAAENDVDAEPQLERAAELQAAWGTALGQTWKLGKHLLLCADATKHESFRRLFAGEAYTLLVTDPPYGVAYADKNAFLNRRGRGNRIQTPIANDHHTPEVMARLWVEAFGCARPCAAPGASYYVTGPQGGELLFGLLGALRTAGFPLRHMLIWAKNNHVLGRCDYHYKHEPILYGWLEGGHRFLGGHSETSVWEIDRPHKSDLHPTTKPLELFARAMRNNSVRGDIVADIFAGSGTAIIAAEQLDRCCRAMEIDPGYVAVSLQRYQDATGQPPTLVES
jgi:site-specific DNA-methyltransferase (adenine-specific)